MTTDSTNTRRKPVEVPSLPPDLAADVARIARIDAVPRILEVVCRTTGMGFSAVARVTESRWVACAVRDEISFGLMPGGELKIETTICDEIRREGKEVVFDHASRDPVFCTHPTPKMYGFESYISIPITLSDGRFFGTLCAIDPRPMRLNTPETIGMFKLFAELIAQHLDAQDRMATVEAALLDERATAQLRDRFIAVLGHDLRNPLGAINTGIWLLRSRMAKDPEALEVLGLMHRSAGRMRALIADVLDFARGHLGDGLNIAPVIEHHVDAVIEQAVAELRSPEHEVVCDLRIDRPVRVDPARIGQLVSNLVANAITHGDAAAVVWLRAAVTGGHFELSVSNSGPPIPPDVQKRLFEPFTRGTARSSKKGLGLGLYIATEIARAHGGTLTVRSTDDQTCFTFRMPMHAE